MLGVWTPDFSHCVGGGKFLFINEFAIGVDEDDNVWLPSLLCWSGRMRAGVSLWARGGVHLCDGGDLGVGLACGREMELGVEGGC